MTRLRARLTQWRQRKAAACRITEEWCGHFIGRRHCARHDTTWDTGGPCPNTTQPG